MPLDERGQGGLGHVVIIGTAPRLESFEELTVRQTDRGTNIVQDPEISEHDALSPLDHASCESRNVTTQGCPRLRDHHEYKGSAREFVPEILEKVSNDRVNNAIIDVPERFQAFARTLQRSRRSRLVVERLTKVR
jgi:hypothetical protein